MASTNLDLVRSVYAAWQRGDFSSVEWAHPDIEFVLAGEAPHPGVWTGHAGMAEGFRSVLSAWREFRVEADEFRELDDERILVLTHRSGQGKTSGLEIAQLGRRGANLFHINDGKVTRLVVYVDVQHAVTDLGLRTESGPAAT